jgi:hypothetical protein
MASTTSTTRVTAKNINGAKTLLSDYLIPDDPDISDFISSVPQTFRDALAKLSEIFDSGDNNATKSSISKDIESGYSTNKYGDSMSSSSVSQYVLNNRQILANQARKFHVEAGTMTSDVDNNLKMLDHPDAKILVSTHQPNLFPYGGVFKKIVFLKTLKDYLTDHNHSNNKSTRIVNLFLIIDHDFMDENWIRTTQLPSMRHDSGVLDLRIPVRTSQRWLMVRNMPLPSRNILEYWKKQLYSWIRKSSLISDVSPSSLMPNSSLDDDAVKSRLINNLGIFWEQVEQSYSAAKSYSDLNAFLMSRIVNSMWKYDTLFVRLSELSPAFANGYVRLVSNFDIYSGILRKTHNLFERHNINIGVSPKSFLKAPLWLHCTCGSKAPTKLNKGALEQNGDLLLEGLCTGCKRPLEMYLGKNKLYGAEERIVEDFISKDEIAQRLSPRAIPIPLLLSSELGVSCYVSGTDGMRYIIYGSQLFGRFVSNNKGHYHQQPLFVVWPAKDNYNGFAQSEALNSVKNVINIKDHIKILREQEANYTSIITPLLEERNRKAKAGQDINNDLSRVFSLKEEQRKIRISIKNAEKVKNVIDMRPSIIDYVVNLGLDNTELQWRQSLLRNDSLSEPINMTVS